MTANSWFLVALVVTFVASLSLQIMGIRWGLRRAGVQLVSRWKAFGLLLLFVVVGGIVAAVLEAALLAISSEISPYVLMLFPQCVQLVVAWLLISRIYKLSLRTASKAVLPLALFMIVLPIGIALFWRTFIFEAFFIPTNSMAPTIVGEHLRAPCPRCGAIGYGSPIDLQRDLPPEGIMMMCSAERRAVMVDEVPQQVFKGDRILACKLIKPRRWDLVVFRTPEDPSIVYVKRLVGLPNEALEIKEGAIWIDGQKLDPPESVKGTYYTPTIEQNGEVYSGPGSVPVKLGPDEYFMLGDNPQRASDSRMWEQGAPGHPPYAVPESYLVGVVVNIYWPPNRWAAFR